MGRFPLASAFPRDAALPPFLLLDFCSLLVAIHSSGRTARFTSRWDSLWAEVFGELATYPALVCSALGPGPLQRPLAALQLLGLLAEEQTFCTPGFFEGLVLRLHGRLLHGEPACPQAEALAACLLLSRVLEAPGWGSWTLEFQQGGRCPFMEVLQALWALGLEVPFCAFVRPRVSGPEEAVWQVQRYWEWFCRGGGREKKGWPEQDGLAPWFLRFTFAQVQAYLGVEQDLRVHLASARGFVLQEPALEFLQDAMESFAGLQNLRPFLFSDVVSCPPRFLEALAFLRSRLPRLCRALADAVFVLSALEQGKAAPAELWASPADFFLGALPFVSPSLVDRGAFDLAAWRSLQLGQRLQPFGQSLQPFGQSSRLQPFGQSSRLQLFRGVFTPGLASSAGCYLKVPAHARGWLQGLLALLKPGGCPRFEFLDGLCGLSASEACEALEAEGAGKALETGLRGALLLGQVFFPEVLGRLLAVALALAPHPALLRRLRAGASGSLTLPSGHRQTCLDLLDLFLPSPVHPACGAREEVALCRACGPWDLGRLRKTFASRLAGLPAAARHILLQKKGGLGGDAGAGRAENLLQNPFEFVASAVLGFGPEAPQAAAGVAGELADLFCQGALNRALFLWCVSSAQNPSGFAAECLSGVFNSAARKRAFATGRWDLQMEAAEGPKKGRPEVLALQKELLALVVSGSPLPRRTAAPLLQTWPFSFDRSLTPLFRPCFARLQQEDREAFLRSWRAIVGGGKGDPMCPAALVSLTPFCYCILPYLETDPLWFTRALCAPFLPGSPVFL